MDKTGECGPGGGRSRDVNYRQAQRPSPNGFLLLVRFLVTREILYVCMGRVLSSTLPR